MLRRIARMLLLGIFSTLLWQCNATGYKRSMVDPSQWTPNVFVEDVSSLIHCAAICKWSNVCEAYSLVNDARQCQLGPSLAADASPGNKEVYNEANTPNPNPAVVAPATTTAPPQVATAEAPGTTTAAAPSTTTDGATVTTTEGTSLTEFSTLSTNTYFRVFDLEVDGSQAFLSCLDLSAKLAEMRNQEEVELFRQVMAHYGTGDYFIGMDDSCKMVPSCTDSHAVWVSDRSAVTWAGEPGYPKISKTAPAGNSCFYWRNANAGGEGEILDEYCDSNSQPAKLKYICMYQGGPTDQSTYSFKMLTDVNWEEANSACNSSSNTEMETLAKIRNQDDWNRLFTYLAPLAPTMQIWVGFSQSDAECSNQTCHGKGIKDINGISIEDEWWPDAKDAKWTPEFHLDKQTPSEKCIWLVFGVGDVSLEDADCDAKAHAVCVKQEINP